MLASASKGEERDKVQAIVDALNAEHRKIEAAWTRLEPKLKAVAKGHDTELGLEEIRALIGTYQTHARFEEVECLPLSQTILGRDSNCMAALGMSMHIRHTLPEVIQRFAGRIWKRRSRAAGGGRCVQVECRDGISHRVCRLPHGLRLLAV